MEEAISSLFDRKLALGTTHLGIGQEAVSVGVASQLTRDDYAVGTYRGHVLALAKGVPMNEIVAEILGKATGCNGGYGGTMHLAQRSVGLIASFSVVGAGIPVALGLGLASKLRGEERITACFFGDGATNNGYFYETMNMAALFGSRVLFAIENNLYSEHTPRSETTRVNELTGLVKQFGLKSASSGGNDVEEVVTSTQRAISAMRSSNEPFALEFKTYRTTGHSKLDEKSKEGPEAEAQKKEWLEKDPITLQRVKLQGRGILSEALDDRINSEVDNEVRTAVQQALDAPWPSPDFMFRSLFDDDLSAPVRPQTARTLQTSMRSAINAALKQSMEKDQSIVLLGEDVAKWGGVYKVTTGLLEAFGPKRVWDTPISESSIAGMTLGLALAGMKPVVEIMFSDFLTLALDAIGNGMAKKRWLTGGHTSVPVVVRTACGFQPGWGATHTQVFDNLFAATPGVRILTPSNAYDAKGLLCAALAGKNPTIFFEHKSLYQDSTSVPVDYYTLPIGKAKVAREGSDVTIVSNLAMVGEALKAAETLIKKNVSVEVIDLRSLVPLDEDTITSSVRKTGSLLVVDESPASGGWSSKIGSLAAEKCLYELKHPVRRVTSPDYPMPFSPELERKTVPTSESIATACLEVLSS